MPTPSYEEQQAALRAQTEASVTDEEDEAGEGAVTRGLKEPEVDPSVYKDTESIIFRGFITLPAVLNDTRFVFKSMNHHEFELLELAVGGVRKNGPSSLFWNTFIAYCVFMVDGSNVLADRERFLPKIIQTFSEFPAQARGRIIRHLSEVNRRATNAVRLAEAFAMEAQSRFRWAQVRGVDLTSTSSTGIPGTQHLGLNWGQLTWRAINYYEDKKEEHDRAWEHAKFVGSCMAGKGISRVYRQDEARRRKEKEARMARKDALLRHVLLGEPLKEKSSRYGVPLVVAQTEDELIDQMEKDLKGEKDWHDYVVDLHENQARQRIEIGRQELQSLVEQHAQEYGDRMVSGGTDLGGLTPDEVRDRIERRRTYESQTAARVMVYPEMLDEKRATFTEKWLGSSVVQPPTERDPSTALPVGESRQSPTVPFNRRR